MQISLESHQKQQHKYFLLTSFSKTFQPTTGFWDGGAVHAVTQIHDASRRTAPIYIQGTNPESLFQRVDECYIANTDTQFGFGIC